MKTLFYSMILGLLITPNVGGQALYGSAEARSRIQGQLQRQKEAAADGQSKTAIEKAAKEPGARLSVYELRARLVQIVDDNRMLLEVSNSYGSGRDKILIVLQHPTAGFLDDERWSQTGWREKIGTSTLESTGTVRYETTRGSMKTVAAFKPTPEDPKPKAVAKARKPAKKPPMPQAPIDPETAAASKLKLIRLLIDDGKVSDAQFRLAQLIESYPDTKAGKEAKKLLDKLKD